ncbi:MAG: hypothetical protein GF372_06555 [Candidatus Marinimicrobia bacterium]|nr:hypothetical protein [Candidatus Neomarinimicrobiota bacterium]
MNKYVIDTRVKKGNIAVSGLPYKDDQDVRVIVIPRADLSQMSFKKVQELTQSISGNLSEDVRLERDSE